METLGEVTLKVNKKHCFKFQVVNGNHKPILSAETCQQLDLIKLNIDHQVHAVQETGTLPLTKESILRDFQNVFEGLGNIGNATIAVDPDVTPVQHAPRRIAVTLRQEVKTKLAELEKEKIIVKETEPTEWISSMVVVAKIPNTKCLRWTRCCRDLARPKFSRR